MNPKGTVNGIRNLASSEKKAQGSIRTNNNARPHNKGAKHTRYHATTPQEARHKLKGAKVFSELDKGNGLQQVTGQEGRITIHNNRLEYGGDGKGHNKNKAAMQEREKRKGANMELSTSTMGEPEEKRLGRIYTEAGESADPNKTQHIIQAGKPETIEDVRSRRQAAA